MIKQYIKQALQTLRENRLTSVISILGTTLSVAMILVVVLQFQIRQAEYSPVSNRSRMLYVQGINARSKQGNDNNNSGLSAQVARECFYPLTSVEAVSMKAYDNLVVSLPGKRLFDEYQVIYTDPAFWKVFDFRFLHGQPFTEADFNSGLPNVVISDYLARRLFNTTDAVGHELLLNNLMECRVAGVVARPTKAVTDTFADVWLPYTCNSAYTESRNCDGICGSFSAVILARSTSDFDTIGDEIQKRTARYNDSKADYILSIGKPLTTLERTLGNGGNYSENRIGWMEYLRTTGLVLLFLLLVPTLNLTGIVQSSIQKRRSEMGLRKAFGATGGRLFTQMVSENLVITLIGGLAGILLSVALLYFGRSFLLSGDTVITFGMIFQPYLFVAALFFTLLINLLSSGLPACRMSRGQIVESLKDENK